MLFYCLNGCFIAVVLQSFPNLCTFRRAISSKMFASLISRSTSKIVRVSGSSATGFLSIWTLCNWLARSPSILFLYELNIFEVFYSNNGLPSKHRPIAWKRHKLSLFGCIFFFLNVRQLIFFWIFNRGSYKTASLQPRGTSLSEAANPVKFANL